MMANRSSRKWRVRAGAAERNLEELRKQLANLRDRVHDVTKDRIHEALSLIVDAMEGKL